MLGKDIAERIMNCIITSFEKSPKIPDIKEFTQVNPCKEYFKIVPAMGYTNVIFETWKGVFNKTVLHSIKEFIVKAFDLKDPRFFFHYSGLRNITNLDMYLSEDMSEVYDSDGRFYSFDMYYMKTFYKSRPFKFINFLKEYTILYEDIMEFEKKGLRDFNDFYQNHYRGSLTFEKIGKREYITILEREHRFPLKFVMSALEDLVRLSFKLTYYEFFFPIKPKYQDFLRKYYKKNGKVYYNFKRKVFVIEENRAYRLLGLQEFVDEIVSHIKTPQAYLRAILPLIHKRGLLNFKKEKRLEVATHLLLFFS